jgi:hypothetical protein
VQLADDVLQVTCRLATQAFVVRISRDALAGREVLIRMRRKPMNHEHHCDIEIRRREKLFEAR